METLHYDKNKTLFRKIATYGGLAVFGVVVFVVMVFSMGNVGKYFLGALINGVPINTPSGSNHFAYGENIGWISSKFVKELTQ